MSWRIYQNNSSINYSLHQLPLVYHNFFDVTICRQKKNPLYKQGRAYKGEVDLLICITSKKQQSTEVSSFHEHSVVLFIHKQLYVVEISLFILYQLFQNTTSQNAYNNILFSLFTFHLP